MSRFAGWVGPVHTLVLDVDEVLLDTRPSFYAAARIAAEEVGGSLSSADIAVFKGTGAFNDDWEMARAAAAIGRWRTRTGATDPLGRLLGEGGLDAVLAWADDPGDLVPRCEDLYLTLADREVPLVDVSRLRALAERGVRLVACTGRTRPQALDAFARLDLRVEAMITAEIARKPDPRALLPLVEGVGTAAYLGDAVSDQRTVEAARPLTATRLWFVRCLPPDATDLSTALAAGADAATAGADPWLAALLELTP